MSSELSESVYTADEVDAAITALGEEGRLAHAQEVVTHAAPALEHVLSAALHEGGWFGSAYESEVTRAAAEPDAAQRERTVGTLVAEQTRLGMFVGVAVGFELARELDRQREQHGTSEQHGTGTTKQHGTGTTEQHSTHPLADSSEAQAITDQATPTEEH
jgi:hypothetical protein